MSIFEIEYLNLYLLAVVLLSIPFILNSAVRMWKIILADRKPNTRNDNKPIRNPKFRKEALKAVLGMVIFFGAIFIMELNAS